MRVRKPVQKELEYLLDIYLARKFVSVPSQTEIEQARAYIRENADVTVLEVRPDHLVMGVVWEGDMYGSFEMIDLP